MNKDKKIKEFENNYRRKQQDREFYKERTKVKKEQRYFE